MAMLDERPNHVETLTERLTRAVCTEFKRQRVSIDGAENLRTISVMAKFDRDGEISEVECQARTGTIMPRR